MLSYTVGLFAPILENFALSKVDQQKLARFANKYYKAATFRLTAPACFEKARDYVNSFLKDSTLPYEVKRAIALLLGMEKRENFTRYIVVRNYDTPSPAEVLAELEREHYELAEMAANKQTGKEFETRIWALGRKIRESRHLFPAQERSPRSAWFDC